MNNYYKRVFAKKVEYDHILFDSKMEADFYRFMKDNGILIKRNTTEYLLLQDRDYYDRFIEFKKDKKLTKASEYQRIQGKRYTPDFVICWTRNGLLLNKNVIVEIKGKQFLNNWNTSRVELLFRSKYPEFEYYVIKTHDDFIPFLAMLKFYVGKMKDFTYYGKVRYDWDKEVKEGV